MSGFGVPSGRRSKRDIAKHRASLIVNPDYKPERFPCIVVDSSKEGFRVRLSVRLKRRQMVEVGIDEEQPQNFQRCTVVWVGKPGSKQENEVGLEIVGVSTN